MNAQTQQDGLVGSTLNWFAHPFNSSGNALTWVLFVGLLIIAAWGWNHILLQIQGEL
jgi:hypothetical protein